MADIFSTEKVIEGIVLALEADTDLSAIKSSYGFSAIIYKAKTRKEIQNPGIFWSTVSDSLQENETPMRVQLSVYATSARELIQIRNRVVAVLHSDTERALGEIAAVWVLYLESYDLDSDDDDKHGSALDFMIIPVRGDR